MKNEELNIDRFGERKMRTLDETIKGLAICCTTKDCVSAELGKCPYNTAAGDSCVTDLHNDALHYLKEYLMQLDYIVAKRKVLEYKTAQYEQMCETVQKQGQEHEDRLQAEIARYQEAVKNCELAENKYKKLAEEASQNLVNTSQNEPLTWDELKAMEGKPVWVENMFYKKWLIAYRINENDIIFDGSGFYTQAFVIDYGKSWQAYRKERG